MKVLLLACAAAACSQLAHGLLGVSPSDAARYEVADGGTWTCLDGTKQLPAAYINDEFCDCADGSDEPGTSACSGLRDKQFWCANKAYRGHTIFSSRVNDGICDCCDGSDEYNGAALCSDKCAAMAVEGNKDIIERRAVVAKGLEAKRVFVEAAKAKKVARDAERVQLQAELETIKPGFDEVEGRHTAFTAAETARMEADTVALTAAAAAAAADSTAGDTTADDTPAEADDEEAKKATEEEEKVAKAARCAWDGTLKGVVGDRLEVDYQDLGEYFAAKITEVTETEGIKKFNVKYENDEKEDETDVPVERTKPLTPDCGNSIEGLDANAEAKCTEVSADTDCGSTTSASCKEGYEGGSAQYTCGNTGQWVPDAGTAALSCTLRAPTAPQLEKVTAEDASLMVEFAKSERSAGVGYTVRAILETGGDAMTATGEDSPITVTGLSNDVAYRVQVVAKNDAGEEESVVSPTAVAPTDLKAEFTKAKEDKEAKENTITQLEGKDDQDLGADNEFEGLRDACVETERHPYTYKFCGFDKVEQQDGGSWTSLGTFTSWEGTDHKHMKFENGQSCWNGPARSVMVSLECGAENMVLKVEEPETCVYKMSVSTPAACTEADMPALLGASEGKDEL